MAIFMRSFCGQNFNEARWKALLRKTPNRCDWKFDEFCMKKLSQALLSCLNWLLGSLWCEKNFMVSGHISLLTFFFFAFFGFIHTVSQNFYLKTHNQVIPKWAIYGFYIKNRKIWRSYNYWKNFKRFPCLVFEIIEVKVFTRFHIW